MFSLFQHVFSYFSVFSISACFLYQWAAGYQRRCDVQLAEITGKLYCNFKVSVTACLNRGIKHDFPFIDICKVPREVLKTQGVARGFQPSRGTLGMLMNDKIMFDRYYCINSTKYCENEENIGALYFITSAHFPTRVRYA